MMMNGSSDGSSDEKFKYTSPPQIVGIELDVVNQVLYWTHEDDRTPPYAIKRLNLTAAVVSIIISCSCLVGNCVLA